MSASPQEMPADVRRPTRIARIATVVLVLFTGLMWWRILTCLALWPQPFEQIFDRFDIHGGMPAPTNLLIRCSHLITGCWPLFAGGAVLVLVGLTWLGMRRKCVGWLGLLSAVSFVAAYALPVVVLYLLYLPLMELFMGVSARR
jgi:hypothetical protein